MLVSIRARVAFVLLSLLLVGCDHATKSWAQAALASAPRLELLPGALDLRYAENRGVAFSLLNDPAHFPLLVALGTAVTAAIIGYWLRRSRPAIEHLGFALVVAGASGNLIDRIARGFVIDFIHLRHWPVFNVADVCITAGALLLWLQAYRRRAPRAT